MLISEEIRIKIGARNKDYFESLGYAIPTYKDNQGRTTIKRGTEITVKVGDLTRGSHSTVYVLCDYCKETITPKIYNQYLSSRKFTGKDCCDNTDCMNKKREEVNMKRYGVSSPMKRVEVRDKVSKAQRMDYNYIFEKFIDRNYILLTEDYINCNQTLEFICLEHKEEGIQTITWHDFNSGCGCYYCGVETSKKKRIIRNMDEIKDIFDKNGFILIEENYINGHTPMKYICKKHKEQGIQYITLYHVLRGQGCKLCGIEKVSGENCYHWKGGKTQLDIALRTMLVDVKWRFNSLKQSGFRCILTGIKTDFQVHHLYSFNKIVDDILEKLNFNLGKSIGDYSEQEWKSIKDEFLRYHIDNLGVPLVEKIHMLYHRVYLDDNTKEQFEDFKQRYYNGEFDNELEEELKSHNSIKRLKENGIEIKLEEAI